MARLNAKRRRELAQRKLLTAAMHEHAPSTQATIGKVRSSHKAKVLNQVTPAVARAYAPKPPMWEGSGKRGRVVKGKLVPPAKAKPWAAN